MKYKKNFLSHGFLKLVKCAIALFVCFYGFQAKAQLPVSEHYMELKKYDSIALFTEKEWDTFNNYKWHKPTERKIIEHTLQKEVFGWHPYWMGSTYLNYDYSLLSELSYFSYEVDAQTGEAVNMHEWLTTSMVDVAQSNGIRTSLTVTLFSDHEIFFSNQDAMDNLISNLIDVVNLRNANGINIDFEAIPESQGSNFTFFMQELCYRFHEEIPGSRVSIALPAVDWRGVFNVSEMNNYVDLFLIMGYGYHWSGSDEAGPNSPKNAGSIWAQISTTRSINYYLENGISPEKLCLAVPYYGRDWPTSGNTVPSSATGNGATVKYSDLVADYLNIYQEYWDDHSSCPAYIYQDNQNNWHQCWVDNAQSLGYKYDHVNLSGIAGIGIWAMGYEGNNMHLSNMIAEKFTDKDKTITEGIFTDTGGAFGKYFENENWTFTILAPENEVIKIVFDELSIEENIDSLFAYDGATTLAPLLGIYTGNLSETDTIFSQSNALCFRFKSNESVQNSGWLAHWWCQGVNAIDFKKEIQDFSVYPNPFSNQLTIELFAESTEISEIFAMNLKGQLIYSKKILLTKGNNKIQLEILQGADAGSYILGIKTGGSYKVHQVIYH